VVVELKGDPRSNVRRNEKNSLKSLFCKFYKTCFKNKMFISRFLFFFQRGNLALVMTIKIKKINCSVMIVGKEGKRK